MRWWKVAWPLLGIGLAVVLWVADPPGKSWILLYAIGIGVASVVYFVRRGRVDHENAHDQARQEPSESPVREALRDNRKALLRVLSWVGFVGFMLWFVSSLGWSVIGPLNDRERQTLRSYQAAPRWQLIAYPPRSADAPLVVATSLDEAACQGLRDRYLRKALDSGGVLPDVRCEHTWPWAERAEMRMLAFREWLHPPREQPTPTRDVLREWLNTPREQPTPSDSR